MYTCLLVNEPLHSISVACIPRSAVAELWWILPTFRSKCANLHSHQLCSDPPPIWSKPCRPLGTGCVPLGRVAKNKPTAEEGRQQGTISQNQATVRTPARTASTAKIPLNPQQSQSSCPHSVHGPTRHSPNLQHSTFNALITGLTNFHNNPKILGS